MEEYVIIVKHNQLQPVAVVIKKEELPLEERASYSKKQYASLRTHQ